MLKINWQSVGMLVVFLNTIITGDAFPVVAAGAKRKSETTLPPTEKKARQKSPRPKSKSPRPKSPLPKSPLSPLAPQIEGEEKSEAESSSAAAAAATSRHEDLITEKQDEPLSMKAKELRKKSEDSSAFDQLEASKISELRKSQVSEAEERKTSLQTTAEKRLSEEVRTKPESKELISEPEAENIPITTVADQETRYGEQKHSPKAKKHVPVVLEAAKSKVI